MGKKSLFRKNSIGREHEGLYEKISEAPFDPNCKETCSLITSLGSCKVSGNFPRFGVSCESQLRSTTSPNRKQKEL